MTAPKREPDERDIDSIISALDVVPVELTHKQAAAVVETLRCGKAPNAGPRCARSRKRSKVSRGN
jgi:hypothetical protein